MEQNSEPKWESKVSTKLTRASPDQIWAIYTDFFNFHKWFPTLATCLGIHGTNGEPGCIRFCSGFSISSQGSSAGHGSEKWSKERLIAIDHRNRCLSYEIVESNIGFSSYISTVKIVPGGVDDANGCVIEWSFTVDPVEGWQLDDMKKRYEKGLQGLAKRIEDICIHAEDTCFLYKATPETLDRLLRTCRFARVVWFGNLETPQRCHF